MSQMARGDPLVMRYVGRNSPRAVASTRRKPVLSRGTGQGWRGGFAVQETRPPPCWAQGSLGSGLRLRGPHPSSSSGQVGAWEGAGRDGSVAGVGSHIAWAGPSRGPDRSQGGWEMTSSTGWSCAQLKLRVCRPDGQSDQPHSKWPVATRD